MIEDDDRKVSYYLSRDLTQVMNTEGEEVWEEFKAYFRSQNVVCRKEGKLSDVMCRVEQFLYQLSVHDLPFNEQLEISIKSVMQTGFIDNQLNLEALHSA